MSGPAIKAVVAVLKNRFPNLTTQETVDLAVAILEAAEKAGS